LEQEFNSLDAQREAGEAYVQAHKHEGWQLVKTKYDDGGISGGHMNRPALQQLLKDIEAGLVDIVVVYKVDRLTRALADFAKMIEVFDKHNVSFVSITQQFNTTSSMGRLTLNVLLSFAQFEREVTSERIRDKFAASKKKGMWMGGPVALGYKVEDRKLLINKETKDDLIFIFDAFLKSKGFIDTLEKIQHIKTYQGNSYNKVTLKTLLANKLVNGKICHKGDVYEGEHEAIIDDETFEKVQQKLLSTKTGVNNKSSKHDYLFKGLIKTTDNYLMQGTHANKGSKKYYYYTSQHALKQGYKSCSSAKILANVNAKKIERLVKDIICSSYDNPKLRYINTNRKFNHILLNIDLDIVADIKWIQVKFDKERLDNELENYHHSANDVKFEKLGNLSVSVRSNIITVKGDITPKDFTTNNVRELNPKSDYILAKLVKAKKWKKEFYDSNLMLKKFAATKNIHNSDLRKLFNLTFLSPQIQTSIIRGSLPTKLSFRQLSQITELDWNLQNKILAA